MRALLIYPRFPRSFWDFEKPLRLIGRKAMLPPLGLVTVAAMLPPGWHLKLVDRNVREVREDEWRWADLVLLTGMIVQKHDLIALIGEARRRGKRVAVGGPYATALPDELARTGADYLVLDEGEITIPLFVRAIAAGEPSGVFRAQGARPDLRETPIPRFDLLDLEAYSEMALQFSRGCPHRCEFCDVTVLFGRRPRTKQPGQFIAELLQLYDLGWRRNIFVVDDNFVAHSREVKAMLRVLRPWLVEHGHPVTFDTQASLDLARDPELLSLMTGCNFGAVFLGIETPDSARLAEAGKHQNLRQPLETSVETITRAGLRVMAGFIIGFDGETAGTGERIVRFVEQTAIPTAFFSMLQALPGTALWQRLEREGRLCGEAGVNQNSLMNFEPTRPLAEVAQEYVRSFHEIYDPSRYLGRAYRHYRLLAAAPRRHRPRRRQRRMVSPRILRALALVLWRQGVWRETRWLFWPYLLGIALHNRRDLFSYLGLCGHFEHFYEFRGIVEREIAQQLEAR
ncbi:MAG: B12-binding domain-containing radical SAM protein, partial [Deltaproteobacteria bacterium]|nr:B12-binding domain-containing radical SAM protein [Deltaproteobacteria bacterium]